MMARLRAFPSPLRWWFTAGLCALMSTLFACGAHDDGAGNAAPRPSFLIAISDDQSWLHTGVAGDRVVATPAFDTVAEEGIYVPNAFCPAPNCSPSRASILTGQAIWRLEEAANLMGPLKSKFVVFPDLLEQAGYRIGYTGKGWGPGDVSACGRERNPAGVEYNGADAYVENFERFLDTVPDDEPFFFWWGSLDPHAPYSASGSIPHADVASVTLPPFIPDTDAIRSRFLDYYGEVQRFDQHLGRFLDVLKARGRLANTLVVVTSDNGMDIPRGKLNLYDYGARVPLAMCWPQRAAAGRVVDDFINLADIAPTFLELAGVPIPADVTAKSFADILLSDNPGIVDPARDRVFLARERHAPSRANNESYPMRALRTRDFLYIRNFAPDRWPAGDPPHYRDAGGGNKFKRPILKTLPPAERLMYYQLCYDKRPAEELYDLATDPEQVVNVAGFPEYAEMQRKLWNELKSYLERTGDPRAFGQDGGWDTMPWTGRFPGAESEPRRN